MISLKTLIGRRSQPATPVITTSFAERLGDMVSADRMATNDIRVELAHVSRSSKAATSSQRVVRNKAKPAHPVKAEVVAVNETKPMARAGVNRLKPAKAPPDTINDHDVGERLRAPTPGAVKVQPAHEAPAHSAPVMDLALMSLDSQKMLERTEVGALQRFRLYAKAKELPLARVKNKAKFANPRTQEAWLAWKEADTQCRIQGVAALKEQILQTRRMVEQIQAQPLITSTQGNEVSDLTMIVKRLAFLLHRADPANTIAAEAMAYLERHNLLSMRGL